MADAPDSKSGVEIHAGSSPASGIFYNHFNIRLKTSILFFKIEVFIIYHSLFGIKPINTGAEEPLGSIYSSTLVSPFFMTPSKTAFLFCPIK